MTITNIADDAMTLYCQINYTLTEVPEDAVYFYAQFRRTSPLPYKEVYTILDGVGVVTICRHPTAWGEGEIKFHIDGNDEFPTICGTVTEDYFCGSYNLDAD